MQCVSYYDNNLFPLNLGRLLGVSNVYAPVSVINSSLGCRVRQMIEGMLVEDEREPRNVQVIIIGGASIILCDEDGEFLRAEPEEQRDDGPPALDAGVDPEKEGEEEDEVERLQAALRDALAENESLKSQVSSMQDVVKREKARAKEMWQANCEFLAQHDELIAAKDAEIQLLKGYLATAEPQGREQTPSELSHPPVEPQPLRTDRRQRRGKAPPIDPFTGENHEIQLDDWIPSLKRASVWNGWSEEELLLQLAGHLRGRALQEWNLLDDTSKTTYSGAIEALRIRLDSGNKTLAAQDFRHISQGDDERVADFIRHLERTFQVAYGRDRMSAEMCDALLHGQLPEV